jgi:RNA polymerase sigma factor (sigma-70 family)
VRLTEGQRAMVESVARDTLGLLRGHIRRAASYTRDDPADLAQDILLDICKAAPKWDGRRPFKALAYVVGLRRLGAGLKKSRRRKGLAKFGPLDKAPADHRLAREEALREADEAAREALALMDPDDAEAVRLYYLEDLTPTEVGERTGCSRQTAHYRVKRGLEAARRGAP